MERGVPWFEGAGEPSGDAERSSWKAGMFS